MILTRTPLRISLFGGGTDLPAFCNHHRGRVLTGAINKYIYVALKPRFDGRTRACYSTTELVDKAEELRHDRIRAVLTKAKVEGVDVVSFSDVPPHGTGLGSSSAFTVGLIHAVYAMRGVECQRYELAAEACKIEIKRCQKPIGYQDQYATALGGLRELTFEPGDDQVGTYQVPQHGAVPRMLREQMLLFYTGIERDADAILAEQSANTPARVQDLQEMAAMADTAGHLLFHGQVDELGPLMDKTWRMKKTLASGISNPRIDLWYERGLAGGATGGKVLGAGGGGFMLFLAPPQRHETIIGLMPDLQYVPFDWDWQGSRVVYQRRMQT